MKTTVFIGAHNTDLVSIMITYPSNYVCLLGLELKNFIIRVGGQVDDIGLVCSWYNGVEGRV